MPPQPVKAVAAKVRASPFSQGPPEAPPFIEHFTPQALELYGSVKALPWQ
mgnify:CR=1 FL=1